MPIRAVDLSAHINETVERGGPAAFPVALRPIFHGDVERREIPDRVAVVREDTGEALGGRINTIHSVPHQRILDIVGQATSSLDVGVVPRGLYVDRRGARMRDLQVPSSYAHRCGR